MLLVVDVGNTQTHFGICRGAELLEHWRFATVRQSTADQLGAALSNLLELRGYGFGHLEGTIDAIRSGVVYGYAGAIDAILRRLYAELGQRAAVIATGGLSGLVVPYTEEIEEVDDLLTLTGLRLLHERNR